MNNKLKTAFTLIELLVVIAIIGILSGLIIVGMSSSIKSATIAKTQIFSASLRDSLLINLISEWKLDGTGVVDGGNATTAYTQDTWGTSNCTIAGSPVVYSGSNCVYGSCIKFNVNADYLNCGNASNLNISGPITVEAWVKPLVDYKLNTPIASGWSGWVSKGDAYNLLWVSYGGRGVTFHTQFNSGYVTYGADLSANTWYNFVGTWDGSNEKLYANGVLVGTSAKTLINTNSSSVTIGSYNAFNGLIDNVRIYSAAVPTSQIKENYYEGVNRLLVKKEVTGQEYENMLKSL